MVTRTTCLECEAVTEKAQAVCELCVPVGEEDACADEPFRAACLSSEYLRDQNKVHHTHNIHLSIHIYHYSSRLRPRELKKN